MTAVWPFIPQKNVVESIEWLTDILKCKKVEYRLCLRAIPRVIYSCKYQLDDGDYGVARELARSVGGDPVFVPDWPTATQIPTISPSTVSLPVDVTHAPAYRVCGSALIWTGNSTHEVVTVTALGTGTISISATVNGYATPWVIPLRLGTFSQEFSGDRGPQTYSTCAAVFTCIDTEDLSGASGGLSYPTYLADDQSVAIPVVTDPVYIINNVQEKNTREVETLDSQTGPLVKYALFSTPNQSAVLAWFVADAPSLWALRVWLHTRRGRWKQFWTSSWNADVTVTKDITAGDGSIQIAAIGRCGQQPLKRIGGEQHEQQKAHAHQAHHGQDARHHRVRQMAAEPGHCQSPHAQHLHPQQQRALVPAPHRGDAVLQRQSAVGVGCHVKHRKIVAHKGCHQAHKSKRDQHKQGISARAGQTHPVFSTVGRARQRQCAKR